VLPVKGEGDVPVRMDWLLPMVFDVMAGVTLMATGEEVSAQPPESTNLLYHELSVSAPGEYPWPEELPPATVYPDWAAVLDTSQV
jgi:hypothetical protein